MIYLLGGSLIGFVISGLFELRLPFLLSVVTAIVAVTGLRCGSRFALLAFWLWVSGILVLLDLLPPGTELFGLPAPAVCMIAGVWVIPVLIWPLAFLKGFDRWLGKR